MEKCDLNVTDAVISVSFYRPSAVRNSQLEPKKKPPGAIGVIRADLSPTTLEVGAGLADWKIWMAH